MINDNTDHNKTIERAIGGCKVRLSFNLQRNDEIERMVLDHLMLSFDRKMKGDEGDKACSLPLPRLHQMSS